jgi:hypothetical protein
MKGPVMGFCCDSDESYSPLLTGNFLSTWIIITKGYFLGMWSYPSIPLEDTLKLDTASKMCKGQGTK